MSTTGDVFVILRSLKIGASAILNVIDQQVYNSNSGTPFWSLDLELSALSESPSHVNGIFKSQIIDVDSADTSSLQLLRSTIPKLTASSSAAVPVKLKFIFPLASGHIARSDFLEQRFACYNDVISAAAFVSPLEYVDAFPVIKTTAKNLESVLRRSVGALRLRRASTLDEISRQILRRLNYPWLLKTPLVLRRIAWVQGREDIDCIQRAFDAAVALGITLVIMDEHGHWLQDQASPWAHYREAFVEVDITADDGLARRVADAVRAYPEPIDGIVTISDVRLAHIARACAMLGLPTEIADAYDIAADKGRTRLLEEGGSGESFVLGSASELDATLAKRENVVGTPLTFPLIVKPVVGWCSDCVSKVRNMEELRVAVEKASERHSNSPTPSTAVVVEPYIDGPEVDANFVLLDGEILFCDVNDDFPSPADDAHADFKANFQETQNVMPTALPTDEVAAIRNQLCKSMLRQGFRSGVFHVEARVRNSRMRYALQDGGILDLEAKPEPPLRQPRVYIHENNARPPGYLESVAVMLAYGVDYYAARMLLAIGEAEKPRLRALTTPFEPAPQFHLSVMIIQQTKAGIMRSEDAAKEWLDKHPEAKDNVVDYYTRKKGGDVLEGPTASALWWIAFYSVVSRTSRRELLKRVDLIQRTFEYEMEETPPQKPQYSTDSSTAAQHRN